MSALRVYFDRKAPVHERISLAIENVPGVDGPGVCIYLPPDVAKQLRDSIDTALRELAEAGVEAAIESERQWS